MKILILGPLDYPTAYMDVKLTNLTFRDKIYSQLYLVEVLRSLNKETAKVTPLYLYAAKCTSQKEYDEFDIFFGLVPKTFVFDRVICYNKTILSTQEGSLGHYSEDYKKEHAKFYKNAMDRFPDIKDNLKEFYCSDDATEFYPDIVTALKHV